MKTSMVRPPVMLATTRTARPDYTKPSSFMDRVYKLSQDYGISVTEALRKLAKDDPEAHKSFLRVCAQIPERVSADIRKSRAAFGIKG